jgi:hypothetical protein
MAINVKPLGDRVLGSPRWDSSCGLFSVPARAICCAWRNIWHERRTAGLLSARKNDRANTGSAVTRPRRWPGLPEANEHLKGKKQMHNTRSAYVLSNLPSLSNKVRSSALFITGTTSSCFIAEDFLYMADAESFRPRFRESIDKAVREYVPRIRNRGWFLGFRSFGLQLHAPTGTRQRLNKYICPLV